MLAATAGPGGHLWEDGSVDDISSGPVSDRMQALLSRAVEEQVSEQRAVSTVLADLRSQVAGLDDSVRRTASEQTVERLATEVATVVADLRTTASLLGSRLDALTSRVQQSSADTTVPVEAATARMTALAAEIADQRAVLEDLAVAMTALASFPTALASLQTDVAGLHDRLSPLPEVRAALGDLATRTTSTLEGLSPRLDALQTKVDVIGNVPDPERLRDAVVDALSGRLGALELLAARPLVGPVELASALATARTSLDQALDERSTTLTAALAAADRRLSQLGERLSDIGDAAGGVPALATDLTRLAARVEQLHVSGTELAGGIAELRSDTGAATLALGVAGLREDVEELATRTADSTAPTLEQTAAVVSARVADRLIETLAPRIADVVLTRVTAALVAQVSVALSPQVRVDTEEVVRAAVADSERRVLAHVDESVLALAEALLRRRRGGRAGAGAARLPADPVNADHGDADPGDAAPGDAVPAGPGASAGDGPESDLDEAGVDVPSDGVIEPTPVNSAPPAPPPADPASPVAGRPDEAVTVAVGRAAVTSSLAPMAPNRSSVAPTRAATTPRDGGAGPGQGVDLERPTAVEPTPDLDDDDSDPVAEQSTPAAVTADPVRTKRKPWWRPGG